MRSLKGMTPQHSQDGEEEVTFALRQAKSSHTLIDKLVHIAALNRYQRLLANYISVRPKAARARAKQLVAMLELFDKSGIASARRRNRAAAKRFAPNDAFGTGR